MKVSYTLTFKEYLRYQYLAFLHTSRMLPWLFYALGSVAFVFLVLPVGADLYIRYVMHLPVPTSVLRDEIITLATPFFTIPLAMAIVMPLAWLLYRRPTLEIDPEGVKFKQHWFNAKARWRAMVLFDEDTDYIYLGSKWLLWGRMVYAMAPKRVFSSDEEARAFYEQALAYREKAVGIPAKRPGTTWPPPPKLPGKETS